MQAPFLIFGLIVAALGAYYCYSIPKQIKTLTEPIDGVICRYEKGWITAQFGNRTQRILGWRAVVTYTVNGAAYYHTCDTNAEIKEPKNIEAKTIPLLYNPAEPGKSIEAIYNQPRSLLAGPIIMLVGIVFIVISFFA